MYIKSSTLKSVFEIMPAIDHTLFSKYFKASHIVEGLNKTHTKTIMILRFEGPMPMSHISQKLSLEKGSFTSVTNKLIQLGYIKKVKSEKDRRVSLLSLTDEGIAYANKLHDGHLVFMEKQINKLTKKEKIAFESSINTLLESLEKINNR